MMFITPRPASIISRLWGCIKSNRKLYLSSHRLPVLTVQVTSIFIPVERLHEGLKFLWISTIPHLLLTLYPPRPLI